MSKALDQLFGLISSSRDPSAIREASQGVDLESKDPVKGYTPLMHAGSSLRGVSLLFSKNPFLIAFAPCSGGREPGSSSNSN